MSDPDQIEKDLKDYLNKEQNLRKEDRYEFLKAIFDKHFSINKLEHRMHYYDIQETIHYAKKCYVDQKVPMFISGKKIDAHELPNIALFESLISYLNSNHLLKKLVKFDYTE